MADPPHVLWKRAFDEHPDDPPARRQRSHDLMVEAGHIVRIADLLLDPEEQAALNADLSEMVRKRRSAEASSRDWPMATPQPEGSEQP